MRTVKADNYTKVSLYSNEVLSLTCKRKYIDSLYGGDATYNESKRNIGFMQKFSNAIGYKPVSLVFDNYNSARSLATPNPEGYKTPSDLIFESLRTPPFSPVVVDFYIPNVTMEHTNKDYSYDGAGIANGWSSFLKKVFPELLVSSEVVDALPEQTLAEFALEYFYRSIGYSCNYTIEFSSATMLTDAEIAAILPIISPLSQDKIGINQFRCESCASNTNDLKPYHIEIEYLTWYGKTLDREQEESPAE